MKVVVLYRNDSEHARPTEEFLREFKRRNPGKQVETLDPDSRSGINLATLYDIMAYPAFIALANDGQLLKIWQGEQLPLINELAAYTMA